MEGTIEERMSTDGQFCHLLSREILRRRFKPSEVNTSCKDHVAASLFLRSTSVLKLSKLQLQMLIRWNHNQCRGLLAICQFC